MLENDENVSDECKQFWFKHITNNGVDVKGLLKHTIDEWMNERNRALSANN